MRSQRNHSKFLDDLARAATGALGSLSEIRKHIKGLVKERVDLMMTEMDFVSRSEFERVEAVAEKARTRQIALEKKLAALEKIIKKQKTTKREKK